MILPVSAARVRDDTTYRHGNRLRVGVLLVNLGTPQAPTGPALRRYLKEFLSDPRVVEIPKLIWWPILNLIILNTRPKKSAAKYASVWMREGSPLRVYSERQLDLCQSELVRRGLDVEIALAMRYGEPSIDETIQHLVAKGVDRLLVLPLYPQYSASTTATVFDRVFESLATLRNPPALRTIRHFHDHPSYISALASRVRAHWAAHGRGDLLLMSFHGVPRRSLLKGDPYHCECYKTARLLAAELGLPQDKWRVSFQSRFGPAEWLKPYTAEQFEQLPAQGVKKLDVVCPGFVSDCLETLEEISMEGREDFLAAGGEDFQAIACLNDSPEAGVMLADLVQQELAGWPTAGETAEQQADRMVGRDRAFELGAER